MTGNMRVALSVNRHGVGAMKALLASCIAGAITVTGAIWLVGGNRPAAAVPDAKVDAVREAAVSFAPSIPGSFLIPGFPDDRFSFEQPSHRDSVPDAGAGKADALAAAAPETPIEPTGSLSSAPATVSRPPPIVEAKIRDAPVETKPVDPGHRDAAQLAPTNCDASSSVSDTGTGDFRYLICYVWSETPPAEKPAAIVLRSFKDIPVGTPVEEIKRASDAFGLDFTFMRAVAKIESGFGPKQRTGSYIGLFQLSKYEIGRFGSGDIINPRDNAV